MNQMRNFTSLARKNVIKHHILWSSSLKSQFFSIIAVWLLFSMDVGAQERYPDETWMRYSTPEEAGWSSAGIDNAKAFADSIGTAAFMLIHDGVVVATFGDYARRYMAHSVRKSLLSGLYGIYVAEGSINLESTLADLGIDDRLPLTPMEKTARIADLLKARSGVYHPAAYESEGMTRSRPERGSHEPGTFYYYNNWDFNVLGEIFRQRTGLGIFDAFERRIAKPLGMEDFRLRDGYYHLEAENSNYPAYPFRMSTRDFARFGLLFEREGRWAGEQIIPISWIRESTQSYSEIDRPDVKGYGYMWWMLDGELGKHGAYTATGVGTQTITVIPKLDIVFVHRVDTYVGDRVSLGAILDLLDQLLEARIGEARPEPNLVNLEDPGSSASIIQLEDELLRRYARTYTYPSGRVVEVRLQDQQLVIHNDRSGTYGLQPLTDSQFLIEDAGMNAFFVVLPGSDSITFVQEMILGPEASELLDQGRTDEAVEILKTIVEYYPSSSRAHRVFGKALIARGDTTAAIASFRQSLKLKPDDVAVEHSLMRLGAEGFEVVQPNPEALESYVGQYRFPGGDTFNLSRDDGRLMITAPGAPMSLPLLAISETVFFLEGETKLVFVSEEKGDVQEVKFFTAGGQEIRAEKMDD